MNNRHDDPADVAIDLTAEPTLKDDLITGATEIGLFIGEDPRTVYALAARKALPIGKLGGKLKASKRRLRKAYDEITSGA